MSANEIELTFIRCPSCKNLMPSTAVKCGMCGFDLGGGDDVSEEQQKKPRLRQKTFSARADELSGSDHSAGLTTDKIPDEENVSSHEHSEEPPYRFSDEAYSKPVQQEVTEDKNIPREERSGPLRFSDDTTTHTTNHDESVAEVSHENSRTDVSPQAEGDAPPGKKENESVKRKVLSPERRLHLSVRPR
jgi:hypothetical protein